MKEAMTNLYYGPAHIMKKALGKGWDYKEGIEVHTRFDDDYVIVTMSDEACAEYQAGIATYRLLKLK